MPNIYANYIILFIKTVPNQSSIIEERETLKLHTFGLNNNPIYSVVGSFGGQIDTGSCSSVAVNG